MSEWILRDVGLVPKERSRKCDEYHKLTRVSPGNLPSTYFDESRAVVRDYDPPVLQSDVYIVLTYGTREISILA